MQDNFSQYAASARPAIAGWIDSLMGVDTTPGNGYELHRYEINCVEYCIELTDGEWMWHEGRDTDSNTYPSLIEALQACIDHASAAAQAHAATYDWNADIREQEAKEARHGY